MDPDDTGDDTPLEGEIVDDELRPAKEFLTGWKSHFVTQLQELPNVSLAAEKAGVSRTHAYKARSSDACFAEAWDDALERSLDIARGEAWRRAAVGYVRVEKKFVDGKQIELKEVTEVDNRLLVNYLQAHDKTWRPKVSAEVSGPDGGPVEHAVTVAALQVSEFEAAIKRLGPAPDAEEVETAQ